MRGAHGFVIPVDAADPAAGAALAFMHLIFHHDDVLGARFGLRAGYGPADPLVARQRRYTFPHGQHLFVSQNSPVHIVWQLVYRTICKFFRKHGFIIPSFASCAPWACMVK